MVQYLLKTVQLRWWNQGYKMRNTEYQIERHTNRDKAMYFMLSVSLLEPTDRVCLLNDLLD